MDQNRLSGTTCFIIAFVCVCVGKSVLTNVANVCAYEHVRDCVCACAHVFVCVWGGGG